MRAIDPRMALVSQLDECKKCKVHFLENIGMTTNEHGDITDEQAAVLAIYINGYHKAEHVFH